MPAKRSLWPKEASPGPAWCLSSSLNRLSPAAHAAISDPANAVYLSAASGWEIATKSRLGKWPGIGELLNNLPQLVIAQGFELLPITCTL